MLAIDGHPSLHAVAAPERPALVMSPTGAITSYGELDQSSNRAAHLLRKHGLEAGETIALLLENRPEFLTIAWAAQRAGLYLVAVPTKLTPSEVEYVVRDSGARLLVTSASLASQACDIAETVSCFTVDDASGRFQSWKDACAICPTTPIADERAGTDMLYTSGTTGRPKGVRPALPDPPDITGPTAMSQIAGEMFGCDADTVYLCPAPLYHAAPLRWSMVVQKLGGTVILMDHFDAEEALHLIEKHRVTHSQWVPTHFIRMLKLPEPVRRAYDLSSLKVALHAAAPCPVPVKRAMIDWWGPLLVEYYAGTEGNGMTMIRATEWLARPGSVGRAMLGKLRICDEAGEPLGPGEEGLVHFEDGPAFSYHNDPEKTAASRNRHGWTTLGDIGRVDEEGYLTLTDRKSFTIISGGVNIYPQEIENLLVTHPRVLDAAVIGAPDEDLGERVVAVIQLLSPDEAGSAFAAQLDAWLRPRLSPVKMPKQFDFVDELPRQATGKLLKRQLRDRYWGGTSGPFAVATHGNGR